ncbi:zonular occludens toxin domain-containing protein [Romboutsia sp. 1001216sp1]|uniref:zonular occludens toxin domain-containing protein n=1 Tax=Romboutsia sp. 1001216sp1 TaxID=2986997 RepID=UPI00232DA467|nr:zonular occludens toxin domain-containing protein [Romboutsia sp. 1001216sp1]MDB8791990.1 zonular occludens toxin domain-containing protein [Romboutsia sp. 1001216sp1]
MIYFYSGTPGSGKSLHVAQDIYNKLFIRKQNVIANFDINREIYNKKKKKGKFLYVPNNELTPEFFYQYAKDHHVLGKESQTLVILDECQILFNPRAWNDKYRINWVNFFTQHRKWGYNFILISQFDRLVDRQIRSLFEYEVKHRKVNNFKLAKLFPISTFCAVEYWYGVKERVGCEFFIYKKKYGQMYDTFKNFEE